MVNSKIVQKLKRAHQNVISAWWVFLIMLIYTVFAILFLGTSCVVSSATGLPCPGCGLTRSFEALLSGDIQASIHYHALLIPTMITFITYGILWLFDKHRIKFIDYLLVVFLFIYIGYFIFRFITMFPNESPLTINYKAIAPRILALFW